jgi:hypothetical protein
MLDTSNKRSTVIADHFASKCVFPENVEAKPCHASNRREKKNLLQNKNESNLGQKEARIEKEKTSELAHMGEKSAQSEKSD